MAKNSEKRLATSQRKKWLQKLQPSDAKPDSGSHPTIRVVLDTNIWYSAIVYGGNPEQLIDTCLEQHHSIITSLGIIEELGVRLKQTPGASYRWRRQLRLRMEAKCEVVEVGDLPAATRDPKDEHVVAAALSGSCNYIISGDNDLVVLGEYRGIAIMKPADFLKLLS